MVASSQNDTLFVTLIVAWYAQHLHVVLTDVQYDTILCNVIMCNTEQWPLV
jgi:hypothetical protein